MNPCEFTVPEIIALTAAAGAVALLIGLAASAVRSALGRNQIDPPWRLRDDPDTHLCRQIYREMASKKPDHRIEYPEKNKPPTQRHAWDNDPWLYRQMTKKERDHRHMN